VYWLEAGKRRRGERPSVTLVCAAVDVGPILREHLFAQDKGVVLTSATLATGHGDFRHAAVRLGCDDPQTLQLGSPFDYGRLVRLIVERAMPEPDHPDYEDELSRRVLHHVRATDGGAFVLFTSFRTLDAVAERIAADLVDMGHPLHVQGTGVPRNTLLERFRADERSVLFGVSSFWQGVDVRGRALRNVIITRLPFEVPDRPIVQARHELIESRGGRPFFEDSLPRAVLRFKQGFGRLVRSSTDEGRVVVLDPRIATKRYGRAFLDALPEGVVPEFEED
jgi:ATP-dependent DNA helicase DinG